ncbi:MAG: glycoside hydrolase family 127 protein [Armatimonadetes bacterium]|nr:glycoside hydrolase family 127 protein [Armatimonadota bacterium]
MPGAPLPLSSIELRDPFWLAWQGAFLSKGLGHQWRQLEETGRLDNFRRAARGEKGGFEGYYFNDSDVFKWLEAASYALAGHPGWEGADLVEQTVSIVQDAQAPDGYLDTAFQLGDMDERWRALTAKHEMYCMGHLMEASVAHKSATGSDDLLNVGRKAADLLVETFGPGRRKGYCGHQEVELALCALGAAVGRDEYASLARWMVEERGSRPSPFEAEFADPVGKRLNEGYVPLVMARGTYDGSYFQDHLPLQEQTEAVGHAVRAMYFYCGALDSGASAGSALRTIWSNLVAKRIYITGGIGSAGRNEGFSMDYDLPNREAYSETCAAIGLVMWAARMSRATGDPQYAEWMERALYNAVLSGVNLDTDRYFYVNPLESRGDRHREPWFGCACCPPNIARLTMSVQRYAAYVSDGVLTIDLPWPARYDLSGGSVEVEGDYPFGGDVRVRIEGDVKARLRIPSWAEGTAGHGYRDVRSGETVALRADPVWFGCDPRVPDNFGRATLVQGPFVYCLEEADLGSATHLFFPDIQDTPIEVSRDDQRVRKCLKVGGRIGHPAATPPLYRPPSPVQMEPAEALFVPYFSWDNRTPGTMTVWQHAGQK